MKNKFLAYLIILLSLISCEKEFRIGELDNMQGSLVINSIAYKDSLFSISVSNSYGKEDAPVKILRAFMHDINMVTSYRGKTWTYPFYVDEFSFDTLGLASEEYKLYTNPGAKVLLYVNGKEEYSFHYNEEKCMYESNYTPQDGDKLNLSVEGYADSTQNEPLLIASEVVIPQKPKIEILNIRYEYKRFPGEWNGRDWIKMSRSDTMAFITLKLHDIPKEKNYYRLKVRTCSWYYQYGGFMFDWYPPDWPQSDGFVDENGWFLHGGSWVPPEGPFVQYINDTYRSDDILFKDDRLTRGYAAWKERFSNVFDDHLFKDGEYIVEIQTPLMYGTDRKLRVELQSLSEDYYQFWKSWMVYRITSDDDFAESIYIHSNVDNGFGIIGAVNSDVHMMDLKIPQQ